MTEAELRAIPPFDKLPFVAEDESESLLRPDQPTKFDGSIAEASDTEEMGTFGSDPNYVPKGAIRYEEGVVRAIYWRKRSD